MKVRLTPLGGKVVVRRIVASAPVTVQPIASASRVSVKAAGQPGPQGNPGTAPPMPDLPDLTLIFDNQLV